MAPIPGNGKIYVMSGLLQTQGQDGRYDQRRVAVFAAVADPPVRSSGDIFFADKIERIQEMDEFTIRLIRLAGCIIFLPPGSEMTGIDGFTTEFAVFPGRKIQRVEGRRRLETGCVHGVFSRLRCHSG